MARRLGKLSDLKAHQQSWDLFIRAKEKMVGLCEKPINIKQVTESDFTTTELRVEVVPADDKTRFYHHAKQLVGLLENDIDARNGYFSLPWNTAATSNQLFELSKVATACFFDYEPQPVIDGEVGRATSQSVESVIARVTNLLQEAALPLPWQILDVRVGEEKLRNQVEFAIRLFTAPEIAGMPVGERNALRYERGQTVVAMQKKLTANGFVDCGVSALLESVEQPSVIKVVKADSYAGVTLLAWHERNTHNIPIQVRSVLYRFRTSSGNKNAQITWLQNFASLLTNHFPGIEVEVIPEIRRLTFRYFLKFDNRTTENLRLQNFLDGHRSEITGQLLYLRLANSSQLRFIAREEPKRRMLDEVERLRKLLKEEIGIVEGRDRFVLGKLGRVQYPFLTISLPPNFSASDRTQALALLAAGTITPNLTGDREKLARLTNALKKVGNPKEELPNPQTRWVLFDATAAVGVEQPAELVPDSATWQEVEQHSFLRLNESQTKAVIATLLAPDLALVQGPPGTGKSTAISQIIWHLVRQNQGRRILLTSETNTAVDNALEKLENEHHNLVKPVRISPVAPFRPPVTGEAPPPSSKLTEPESGMEREGARYALPRLTAWAETPEDELTAETKDNIIRRWLLNIARRAVRSSPVELPVKLQTAWTEALAAPSQELKANFLQHYLQYANVVGATGGALGELSTRNKPTNFYRQYQTIFGSRLSATDTERAAQAAVAEAAKTPTTNQRATQRKPDKAPGGIRFDVVVMDEASKATPPELALAMIYAHKAVIIGDHRQLPPMLDENDFRSTLLAAGEADLAEQFSRVDAETSQFERLFTQKGVQPGIVSRFDTQYRMHPDINAVIEQFYTDDGGLKCGIPTESADAPNLRHPLSRYHGLSHPALVQPNDHIVWVDADGPEMEVNDSRINLSEVQAVEATLACLAQSQGFADFQQHWSKPEDQEVALITFYGRQVQLLNEVAARFEATIPTRVQTVDKFQGMERNIVVVSLVRSDKITQARTQRPDLEAFPDSGGYQPQHSLGFAQFPNRLNVALSRAKRLLIIVGNSRHFSRHDCYRRVFETVQARGRVVNHADLLPFLAS
jgi:hypothetical protein